MTDNVAVLAGFTRALTASCDECDLYLLVAPDTDLDSTFKAWDCDAQEFIRVNGWLFTFVDSNEAAIDDFNYVGSRHHY